MFKNGAVLHQRVDWTIFLNCAAVLDILIYLPFLQLDFTELKRLSLPKHMFQSK